MEAEAEEFLGLLPDPGERVEDAPDRPVERGELVDDVAMTVPAVDDDRPVELVGQVEVAAEIILLDVERGPVPVAVEPGLADGDHLEDGSREPDHLVPVAGPRVARVVGMDADGSKNPGMGLGEGR